MTIIAIKNDQTIALEDKHNNCNSLFNIMARGNVEYANHLDAHELWAVMVSVKTAPFPLGHAESVYRKVLKMVKTDPAKVFANGSMPDMPLGDLRKAIVFQAGDGCNAPTDSYLRIAKQIKLGEYVDSY